MNYNFLQKFRENQKYQISAIIIGFALICIGYAFFVQDVHGIIDGLRKIITSKCALITDYYDVGGMGATLINVGVLALLFLLLNHLAKAEFNGFTLATFFITAGFTFFGKNLVNVWPIILGNYLYAILFKVKYKDTVKIGMLSTALAPIVSEAYFMLSTDVIIYKLLFALFIGILVGLVTPMVGKFTPKCHQGYQLYNIGFAAGIVGMAFVAVFNYSNYTVVGNSHWSSAYLIESIILMSLIALYYLILSLIIDPKGYKNLIPLVRNQTQNGCDYIKKFGTATTLLNIVIVCVFYTALVPILGAPLSGAAVGAIQSIIGFAAYGKNLYNSFFIMLGILILTLIEGADLSATGVILAILFGTCLAPITDRYGPICGILAGALHVCVVRNVLVLHSGLNLYNNGFSAGMVCIFIIPIFDALKERFPKSFLFINIKHLD